MTKAAAVFHDYDGFVLYMVERRKKLGLTQEAVDQLAGWPDGYCGKLEAWKGPQGRTAGSVSMPIWWEVLAVNLRPVVVEASPRRRDGPKLNGAAMATRLPAGVSMERRRRAPDPERCLPADDRVRQRPGRTHERVFVSSSVDDLEWAG